MIMFGGFLVSGAEMTCLYLKCEKVFAPLVRSKNAWLVNELEPSSVRNVSELENIFEKV